MTDNKITVLEGGATISGGQQILEDKILKVNIFLRVNICGGRHLWRSIFLGGYKKVGGKKIS